MEIPEALIPAQIETRYVGKIKSIQALGPEHYQVCLAYQYDILSGQFNQLLNLCLGNISMYPQLRLVDIQLSDQTLSLFQGPQFGIQGVRQLTQAGKRPLLATALKPRGSSTQQLADMAYAFAAGGGDLLKDDQNLIGDFAEFKQRVLACQQALHKAADKTGKECLYFPFVSAPYEQLHEILDWAKQQDIKGVLLAPAILGFDHARGLAQCYQMIYMAHPSFSGSYCIAPDTGMAHHLLYGLLYRLAGVDISVFPNAGGRFNFSQSNCDQIVAQCRTPMAGIKPNFACPAGGMQFRDLALMSRNYGQDSIFLCGGSLLQHSASLEQSTREFLVEIDKHFQHAQVEVAQDRPDHSASNHISACELSTGHNARQAQLDYLCFDNFTWQGRAAEAYKKHSRASFLGITRTELIGKQGEQLNFELRYFEIEAGGYTSLEKHLHTHVIIIARGQGQVQMADQSCQVKTNDVLYIEPLCVHQLSNPHPSIFGFYCIVDKQRDRPVLI